MEISELLLVAAIAISPTIVDLLFQYGIHRHMEEGRPPCKNCALRAALDSLENLE